MRFSLRLVAILFGVLSVAIGIFVVAAPTQAQTIQEICRRAFLDVLQLSSVGPAFRFPFANELSRAVGPAALVIGFLNLLFAVPFENITRFIQFVLSEPGIAIFGRKRKGFGVVYDSLSKKPLALALVRLISEDTGRIIRTRVTDRDGRFTFFLTKGRYRLDAAKQGYTYPSHFLAGETSDINYGPIITGEAVSLKENSVLDVNLPMDGPEDKIELAQAIRRKWRAVIHAFFAYFGIIVSAMVVVYSWTVLSWVLFAVHILLFLLFTRLARRERGRPWGRVYDLKNTQSVPRAVVRIMDTKFSRILETAVTDATGRYGFLVGRNNYQIETLRSGYERYRSKPFTPANRPALVIQDIPLKASTAPVIAPEALKAT